MSETANTEPVRAEIERASATGERKTVLQLLEEMQPEIAKALPAQVGAERFTRTVLTEIRRTPKLLECEPRSLLGAMMLAAQLGLEPGPLGHVYLIPFKGQVEFVIGYKGMIELAYRSDRIKDVMAALVFDGDEFEYQYGTQPKLVHKPQGPRDDREIVASYAVARTRAGGAPFVVTYEEDWERARKASAAGSKNVGPWVDDRPAMIRKTSVRRLAAFVPQSPQLAVALDRDEQDAPPLDEELIA